MDMIIDFTHGSEWENYLIFVQDYISIEVLHNNTFTCRSHCGRDHMIVELITSYAISSNHH